MKRIFFAGIGIFLLFVLSACPQAAIDDADDRGDDFPDLGLEEFSLNAASMVLFIDGGEKRLTALIPSEIAGLVEIEWSMNETSVVEISVDDDSVVVVPKDVGNAEIKAVIKSKFNNLNISEVTCHVTVLEDFDLDAQRLLMFVDDSPKKVSARVPPAMLDVAEIEWSLDSARNDAFALQNEAANSVDIETLGVEAIGVVTATLKAKNAAAFNGEGRSAVCVVTTLSRPFIEFPQSAYSYMLRPNDTSRTSLLTALYGPSKIDAYNPQVSWVSDDTEIVAFNEAGSVSMGRATTMITAKSAGSTVISVTLSIPDVMETSISVPVSVVPYDVPENSVTSLTLDIKPASIVRTMYTELITANLTGAGGSPPSDPDVEWLVDELGVVELVDGGDAYNRSIYVLGIWDGLEPKTVTVTAMSVSNPDITDWFTITASHFNVTVTTEAPDASTVLSVDNPNPINLKAVINGISNTAVAWSSDMPQFVTLTTPQEESGDTVTVSLKDNVLINGTKTVRITAVSLADNVTSGYIDIQILPHTFMVRYHKNDGSSITQMGGPYSFGSNTQTLDAFAGFNWIWTGYRNRGWSISAVGPLVYRDEALISALNDNENAAHHGGTVDLYARWLDDMSFEDEEDFAVTDVIYRYTINDQHEWNNVVQAIKNSGQGNYVINIQTNFTFNASSLLNSFMFGEAASFDQKTISIRGTDRMEKRTVRLYQHDGQLSAPDAFFVLHQNQHIILRNIKFIGYAGNVSNSNAYPFLIARTGSTFEMKSGAVLDTLNNNNYVNDQNGSIRTY